jgi:hypothetical protein
MRTLFAAVLFTGTVAGFSGVNAADGCGAGCHATHRPVHVSWMAGAPLT